MPFSADVAERKIAIIRTNSTSLVTEETHRAPHHGVGLPRAGLTVGEDAGVVALKGRLQHVQTQIFKNLKTHTYTKHQSKAVSDLTQKSLITPAQVYVQFNRVWLCTAQIHLDKVVVVVESVV